MTGSIRRDTRCIRSGCCSPPFPPDTARIRRPAPRRKDMARSGSIRFRPARGECRCRTSSRSRRGPPTRHSGSCSNSAATPRPVFAENKVRRKHRGTRFRPGVRRCGIGCGPGWLHRRGRGWRIRMCFAPPRLGRTCRPSALGADAEIVRRFGGDAGGAPVVRDGEGSGGAVVECRSISAGNFSERKDRRVSKDGVAGVVRVGRAR